MSIIATDIQWVKSSNGSSDGGTISATQIVDGVLNNLFPDVTGDQAATGVIQYKKVFIKNNHSTLTLTAPVLWFGRIPSSQETALIALGTSSDTSPTSGSLTYVTPTDKSTGIALGDLAPGASVGVWIQKAVPKGTTAFPVVSSQLIVEGATS